MFLVNSYYIGFPNLLQELTLYFAVFNKRKGVELGISHEERVTARQESYEIFEAIRKERKVSKAQICRDLGFNKVIFSDWKRGISSPNAEKIVKLSDYLNVDAKLLIN